MPRLKPIHGKDLIKILCNYFGFLTVRQKGSHVTLQRNSTFVTVPLKEIQVGLLNQTMGRKYFVFRIALTAPYSTYSYWTTGFASQA